MDKLINSLKSLDVKQLLILEDFINGKNIFMSGPGGTGKSYLIHIIKQLCLLSKKNFHITALTGCAALLLNGKTVNSWAGTGIISSNDIKHYINRIKKSKKTINWTDIDVLVIDEVSMLSKKFFIILDSIGKLIRKNDKPFGGIQLIFSGDFYQLPPIQGKDEPDNNASLFCFEADNWSETFPEIHILTKVFRQENKEFSKLLNNIRVGNITENNVETLKSRIIPFENTDIIPTKLYPTNISVDSINKAEHDKLPERSCKTFSTKVIRPTEKDIYDNDISETMIKYSTESIIKNNAPIEIKIGDQVICTYNISDTIVNGSRGVVTDIREYPVVKFIDNEIEMRPIDIFDENVKGLSYKKIPLKYAWALTIHKCQGMTLDLCIMDIGSNIFAPGQIYVALSRVKSLDGLYLLNFNHKKIKTMRIVKDFYAKYENKVYTKDERNLEKKRIKKLINDYLEECKKIKVVEKVEKPINQEIVSKLNEYRKKIATEKDIKCYRILTNETVNNIARDLPKDKDDLLSIKGIGPKTLETYGDDILTIINN